MKKSATKESVNFVLKIYVSCLFLICSMQIDGRAGQYFGLVADQDGRPLHGAIVRIQGTTHTGKTDKTGCFQIHADAINDSRHITAWKMGYYIGADEITKEKSAYRIELAPIFSSDNTEYKFLPSKYHGSHVGNASTGEDRPCQICHPAIVKEWERDAHSRSARNPVFLSFFNGTDATGIKLEPPGYKIDFMNSNGNCATCHVPILAFRNPFNANPNGCGSVVDDYQPNNSRHLEWQN